MAFDVRNSEMTEEEAYILTYTLAKGKWARKPGEYVLGYYDYVMTHTGYFAVCGAKGCIRACMDMLEKADRIENKFHNNFYRKKSWSIPNKPEVLPRGVNPYREQMLDEKYPGIRENEYERKE